MSMKIWAWWRAYDAWQSPDLVGDLRERTAHLALDRVGRQERLGIHRVHVVDAVQQRRRHAAIAQGPGDDVEDDRARGGSRRGPSPRASSSC